MGLVAPETEARTEPRKAEPYLPGKGLAIRQLGNVLPRKGPWGQPEHCYCHQSMSEAPTCGSKADAQLARHRHSRKHTPHSLRMPRGGRDGDTPPDPRGLFPGLGRCGLISISQSNLVGKSGLSLSIFYEWARTVQTIVNKANPVLQSLRNTLWLSLLRMLLPGLPELFCVSLVSTQEPLLRARLWI